MTYFKLRKQADEPELEEVEEPEEEPEEAAGEPDEEARKERTHGPIVTGLLGPWQWLAAHFNLDTAVIVHVGAVGSAVLYGGWVAVGVIVAWLAAVLAFVPRENLECAAAWFEQLSKRAATAPDAPGPEGDNPLNADPQQVYAATLEWICGQIADRNGIHLSDLLANAHAHGLHTDLDVVAFRAVLERWGFPIRQQLKVGGKNRPGIHREDLPQQPLPSPSPEESGSATTTSTYRL